MYHVLVSAFIVHNTKGCIFCRSWVTYCETNSQVPIKKYLCNQFSGKSCILDSILKTIDPGVCLSILCHIPTCTFNSPFAMKSVSVKASDSNKCYKTFDLNNNLLEYDCVNWCEWC